jgi:lauroyl/myristoyl acyltransferase
MVRQPDNSLKLVIEPELELERTAKGKNEIRENTIRITQWLERSVRAYPDQWNWTNIRRWGPPNKHPVSSSEPVQPAYR